MTKKEIGSDTEVFVPVDLSILDKKPTSRSKRSKARPENINAIKLYGQEIGLPPDQCEAFFDFYESKGWKVGRSPMLDWKAALRNWKRRQNEGHVGSNGKPKLSELRTVMEAKEREREKLRRDYGTQTANGFQWDDPQARADCAKLKAEIDALNKKIGAYALQ